MWSKNCKVKATFASNDPQWAWAHIEGLGWRRIKGGAPDGVANIFRMMCTAKVRGRLVNVDLDEKNLITTAYLL
ncbi:MAG: hypothetical protein HPY61_11535 [Methanotrichaceae archaeon]|nr:hypothetical protein [Methanotrichaceae archaeon]